MKKIVILFLMTLSFFLFLHPAFAETETDPDLPWDKFSLNLGGFITSLDSGVRLGSDTVGVGVDVDVEDFLGLESSTKTFRADALYRFGSTSRHRFDFSYYDFRRNSEKVLEKDFEIGDETFTAGTTVNSYWNMKIFKAKYGYSFFLDDRIDIAATLGLFVLPIEVGVEASGLGDEATDITAPLPTLGLRADFAITPKLFIKQNIDLFYLEYDQFKGSIMEVLLAVEYNIWDNIGLGMGYNAFQVNIEAENEDYPGIDFNGEIGFNYNGLLLYGKLYF